MTNATLILPFDGVSPELDESAWAAPTATLIGKVTLGPDSSVFYGAVLRGDMDAISLGARSNVQDNVSVHCDSGRPTVIGAGVSIGHSAVVHGCTIEDDCLIGMSATVLNGAVIGAGSLIAAGAVVREGSVIPPRSLVTGVPGTVRREVTEAETERIRRNAEIYVGLGREHRAIEG
jgi:carbonic anhydrase/acetyltransferase-like protein (isoleucine patch superfamily)